MRTHTSMHTHVIIGMAELKKNIEFVNLYLKNAMMGIEAKLVFGVIFSSYFLFMNPAHPMSGLSILFVLIILDFISGVMVAFYKKIFSSKAFAMGLWKLMAYVLAISTIRLLDIALFKGQTFFTEVAVGIFIVTEGISILENTIIMGVPIPASFLFALSKYSTNIQRFENGTVISKNCNPKTRKEYNSINIRKDKS